MNITALDKIEKSYIKRDWKEVSKTIKLSIKDMDTIVDIINTFKKNKSATELVILKYKNIPLYITVSDYDYKNILNWIMDRFIKLELYEKCKNIEKIKSKL